MLMLSLFHLVEDRKLQGCDGGGCKTEGLRWLYEPLMIEFKCNDRDPKFVRVCTNCSSCRSCRSWGYIRLDLWHLLRHFGKLEIRVNIWAPNTQ